MTSIYPTAGDPSTCAPNAEFAELWNSLPYKFSLNGDIHTIREVAKVPTERAKANWGKFEGTVEEIEIEMRDGVKIPIRVYTPPHATGKEPVLVWFHGGGFCLGNLDVDEVWCRRAALETSTVVVNVEYRLAPENVFPVAVNDAYDSVKWVAENAHRILKADLSAGFVVGGSSAGANLACVVSHQAKDEELSPPLTGIHLGIPLVIDRDAVPAEYQSSYKSHEQNKDAPILDIGALDNFKRNYNGSTDDPRWSPFLWPSGHHGLPPTYFQMCGQDPLRDDGLIYEKVLREDSGVKTKMDFYPGLPHGFSAIFAHLECSKNFEKDRIGGLKWLLHQS